MPRHNFGLFHKIQIDISMLRPSTILCETTHRNITQHNLSPRLLYTSTSINETSNMTASFVLTFRGIDFLLDSKQSGATIAFDHANSSNEEILLALNNFTGNLRVSTATTSATSIASSSKTATSDTTSGRVSLSPENRQVQSKPKPKTIRRPQPPATNKVREFLLKRI